MGAIGVIALFLIALVLIILGFGVISLNSDDDQQEEGSGVDDHSLSEESRLECTARLGELVSKYGMVTTDIPLSGATGSYMYVFEDAQMLVVAGEPIPFKKIRSYTLADDPHTRSVQVGEAQTDTSTDSMLGRAMVGGLLFRSKGALAGALTASKTTEVVTTTDHTVTHSYKIYLGLNDLSNPQRLLVFGEDEVSANKATIILDIILNNNKDLLSMTD